MYTKTVALSVRVVSKASDVTLSVLMASTSNQIPRAPPVCEQLGLVSRETEVWAAYVLGLQVKNVSMHMSKSKNKLKELM